jgi:hypothetical protein
MMEASLSGQRARGVVASEEKGDSFIALQTDASVGAGGKNSAIDGDLPGEGKGGGGFGQGLSVGVLYSAGGRRPGRTIKA